MADKVGLSSPDAVKQWKRGKGCPADVERVKACAEVLGVNFMDLLTPCVEKEMFYIDEEINLATNLSYDYPEIPNEYYDDTSLDGESLDENGNPRDLTPLAHPELGLTPKILFKDYATRLMKNAFRVEFPEIEHMFA